MSEQPPTTPTGFAALLAGLDLSSPDGKKRALAIALTAAFVLFANPALVKLGLPQVPEAVIIAFIGLVSVWVFGSNAKAKARVEAAAASAAVATPDAATDVVNKGPQP